MFMFPITKKALSIGQRDLNRILVFFLTVCFLLTTYIAYQHRVALDPWVVGDWLINYQSGFVRRGLIGEILFLASQQTGIPSENFVMAIQLICYSIFFVVSYILIKDDVYPAIYIPLIISPFLFFFQVMGPEGGFRKEILYFALLAINCWSVVKAKKIVRTRIAYTTLLVYPLIILSHEILAIFFPIILIIQKDIFVEDIKKSVVLFIVIVALFSLSVVAFAFSLAFKGGYDVVYTICQSLRDFCGPGRIGAIDWLKFDSDHAARLVRHMMLNSETVFKYSIVIILSSLAFFPVRHRLKYLFSDVKTVLLLLCSVIGAFMAMRLALDWGRFIYIWCVTLFFLSFLHKNKRRKKSQPPPVIALSIGSIILYTLYFLSWKIPHCCSYTMIGPVPVAIYNFIFY